MADEEVFEIEFHNGNITIWAILPVPEVGQSDTDPVRKKLATYEYRDLPVSTIDIDGVRSIIQGDEATDSIALRADHVTIRDEDAADETPSTEAGDHD